MIDVAGYSARIEADETAALNSVADVRARVEAAAVQHGGRLFKTAGDGFLLEFPTVTGALRAADDVRTDAVLPVRIGVHIGEVSVTDDGDLLGHGVNIAARLQAKAAVGEILASADVARAVRGQEAEHLVSRGRMQLAKMRETLPVYAFLHQRPAGAGRTRPPWRPRRWGIAAGLVVLVVAAATLWPLRSSILGLAPAPPSVAILAWRQDGSPAAADLAKGVADKVREALSASQAMLVEAPDAASGRASLVATGTAATTPKGLQVTTTITDPSSHLVMWSHDFDADAGRSTELLEQAASKTADVLVCAVSGYDRRWRLDRESKSLWVKQCAMRRDRVTFDPEIGLLRALTDRAPNFSLAFSSLAIDMAMSSDHQSPGFAQTTEPQARAAAMRAIATDPKNAEAYMALALLTPETRLAEKEQWLLKGLAAAPNHPQLLAREAFLLESTGRTAEAAAFITRSLAVDPRSPSYSIAQAEMWRDLGRNQDADEAIRRTALTFPQFRGLRFYAFQRAVLDDPGRLAAMLDDPSTLPPGTSVAQIALWRDYLHARQGGPEATQRMAQQLLAAIRGKQINRDAAFRALLLIADPGFLISALQTFGPGSGFLEDGLFGPEAAPLRHDPRFMQLAAKLGLVDYWRTTGKWPDFCAEPQLPYSCPAEAAKLGHG